MNELCFYLLWDDSCQSTWPTSLASSAQLSTRKTRTKAYGPWETSCHFTLSENSSCECVYACVCIIERETCCTSTWHLPSLNLSCKFKEQLLICVFKFLTALCACVHLCVSNVSCFNFLCSKKVVRSRTLCDYECYL